MLMFGFNDASTHEGHLRQNISHVRMKKKTKNEFKIKNYIFLKRLMCL